MNSVYAALAFQATRAGTMFLSLDDLVLQRGNAQRALPVRPQDEPSPHGQRPVRAAVDPGMEGLKVSSCHPRPVRHGG